MFYYYLFCWFAISWVPKVWHKSSSHMSASIEKREETNQAQQWKTSKETSSNNKIKKKKTRKNKGSSDYLKKKETRWRHVSYINYVSKIVFVYLVT